MWRDGVFSLEVSLPNRLRVMTSPLLPHIRPPHSASARTPNLKLDLAGHPQLPLLRIR